MSADLNTPPDLAHINECLAKPASTDPLDPLNPYYTRCKRCRRQLPKEDIGWAVCDQCRAEAEVASNAPFMKMIVKGVGADPVNPGHYKNLKPEPFDVIESWGLGFLAGNVIKYIARYRNKNGIEDLKKARCYLDRLIAQEEKATIKIG